MCVCIYIYIYINARLKLKKKKNLSIAQPSQEDAKMATQILLIRPTHKKHKTNLITPITTTTTTTKKKNLKAQT